jgi:DNA-directed RNA polymerase specialized sigma24 family protein
MEDFDRWYAREHPRVFAACAALTGEVDEAGEATDEAFARALARWTAVSAMLSPGGWVQVVALNHLRRNLRRRSAERRLARLFHGEPVVVKPPIPDPDLWACVAQLPGRQRAAIVLRYVHDLPEAAISESMGISRGTVASTLAAARASLQQRVAQPIADDASRSNKESLR